MECCKKNPFIPTTIINGDVIQNQKNGINKITKKFLHDKKAKNSLHL